MYRIHCQEPWFSKIRSGLKAVEGRKYNTKYLNLKSGDLLEFYCDEESFLAEVVEIIVYKTLEEYLEIEGFQNVLPGVSSFEEAVGVYLQHNSRDELDKAGGFLGIHVKLKSHEIDNVWMRLFQRTKINNEQLLTSKPISKQFNHIGIDNLYSAIQYVNDLRYAPPSENFNWQLVLTEKCGTCSTKHALLVELGKELGVPFELGGGIYKMSSTNFSMLKDILSDAGLSFIPESHNFIVYNDFWLDVTFPKAAKILNHNEIEQMQIISIADLVRIKTQLYPKFLRQWLLENKPEMSMDAYAELHKKIVNTLGTLD